VTFQRIKPRQVGTGYYLLFSSIISILIIIVLTFKFWLLVCSQMSLITNRSFLYLNCISLDVILKIVLSSSEWLNASVAIERMFTVIQGASFSKTKSKKVSKWVILSIFLLTILTHIHDPIIPPTLIFIVFVLPSKNYKSEFDTVVEQTMRRFRTII
jgi:hypothetical protein